MMRRILLMLVCCPLLVMAAPLVGRMEDETYVSPTGQFRVRSPVLPELGGIISDTANVVTFQDNYGTHVSIACFEFDATQRWEFETRSRRDYLLYFFNEFVMANFIARFPGSTIQSARYLPEVQEGALIGYSLLPGGSEFEQVNRVLGGPPLDPVTAKRGTLLFVHDRRIYAITIELAERALQRSTYRLTTAQEDDLLASRLLAMLGRITFTNERPRPASP